MSPREELTAGLHSMVRDMPTATEFLAGWTSVTAGGTSTSSIINAVSPITIISSTLHQLITTLGVQIATIPVSIPLDAGQSLKEGPITYQSHLWMEGHFPCEGEDDSQERIVELELDKEVETQSEGHDESQESTQGRKPAETVEESGRGTPDDEPMEAIEGESEKSPEPDRGHDTCLTLTTEEDSEQEAGEQ